MNPHMKKEPKRCCCCLRFGTSRNILILTYLVGVVMCFNIPKTNCTESSRNIRKGARVGGSNNVVQQQTDDTGSSATTVTSITTSRNSIIWNVKDQQSIFHRRLPPHPHKSSGSGGSSGGGGGGGGGGDDDQYDDDDESSSGGGGGGGGEGDGKGSGKGKYLGCLGYTTKQLNHHWKNGTTPPQCSYNHHVTVTTNSTKTTTTTTNTTVTTTNTTTTATSNSGGKNDNSRSGGSENTSTSKFTGTKTKKTDKVVTVTNEDFENVYGDDDGQYEDDDQQDEEDNDGDEREGNDAGAAEGNDNDGNNQGGGEANDEGENNQNGGNENGAQENEVDNNGQVEEQGENGGEENVNEDQEDEGVMYEQLDDTDSYDPYEDFNIKQCDTYENLWLWDLALTCDDEELEDSCHCTFASKLMRKKALTCSDISRCPKGCDVCKTCLGLLGCEDKRISLASAVTSNPFWIILIAVAVLSCCVIFGVAIHAKSKRRSNRLHKTYLNVGLMEGEDSSSTTGSTAGRSRSPLLSSNQSTPQSSPIWLAPSIDHNDTYDESLKKKLETPSLDSHRSSGGMQYWLAPVPRQGQVNEYIVDVSDCAQFVPPPSVSVVVPMPYPKDSTVESVWLAPDVSSLIEKRFLGQEQDTVATPDKVWLVPDSSSSTVNENEATMVTPNATDSEYSANEASSQEKEDPTNEVNCEPPSDKEAVQCTEFDVGKCAPVTSSPPLLNAKDENEVHEKMRCETNATECETSEDDSINQSLILERQKTTFEKIWSEPAIPSVIEQRGNETIQEVLGIQSDAPCVDSDVTSPSGEESEDDTTEQSDNESDFIPQLDEESDIAPPSDNDQVNESGCL